MLLDAFGDLYREYRREVAALIPFPRRPRKRA
jgi:protein-S-isoprenylcysteine O-methyltransferase Ste14